MLHRNLPLKAAAFALAIFLWFWVLLNEQRPIVGTPTKAPITGRPAREEMSARTLPVVVRTRGQLPTDVTIVSVQVEPPMVTVVGPPAPLQGLTQVETRPLTLSQVRGDLTKELPLVAPPKLSLLSDSSVTVKVKVVKASALTPGEPEHPPAR